MTDMIQYNGLNDFEPVEQAMIKTLVDEYASKISRALHNDTSLTVHIKSHSKGGKRERIEISVRVAAPTKIFEAKSEEWDLSKAVHEVFKALLLQIEKEFSEN